jgi:hypothetical protein
MKGAKFVLTATAAIFLLSAVFLLALFSGATAIIAARAEEEFSVNIPETYSFVYDGNPHLATATVSDDKTCSFLWYKDGSETPCSENARLVLKNVSDSGEYTVKAIYTENGTEYSATSGIMTVTVSAKVVAAVWRRGASATYPVYSSSNCFTYNGCLQGVYPYPETVCDGDTLYIDAVGNTAKNAGVYTARATRLSGLSAENYALEEKNSSISFTVGKAPLSVTVGDAEITYGETFSPKDVAVTLSGLAECDFAECLGGSVSCSYALYGDVWTYPISYSITDNNYSLILDKGVLTVNPKPIEITLSDAKSVYGDPIVFAEPSYVSLNGDDLSVAQNIISADAGNYGISAVCENTNYDATFVSARYTVEKRPVSVTVGNAESRYGATPVYDCSADGLAAGETLADLKLSFGSPPRTVGVFPISVVCGSGNYDAVFFKGTLTVTPMPIHITVFDTWSFYGDTFSVPDYRADATLPYGDKTSDLGISVEKADGRHVGDYALTGTISNANYSAVFDEANYRILPRFLYITLSAPKDTVLSDGETGEIEYSATGVVGSDDPALIFEYELLSERGTVESVSDKATRAGTYIITAQAENTDYFLCGTSSVTVVFSSDTMTENGAVIELYGGFTPAVTATVTKADEVSSYQSEYGNAFDLQEVYAFYNIKVEHSSDSKMTVKIPVDDENRHYTVAIVKNDGTVSYTECVVKDGFASFRVQTEFSDFIVWRDKDNGAYFAADVFLLFFIIIEIIIIAPLVPQAKKRGKKLFAFAPLAYGNLGFVSVYTCVAVMCVEIPVALSLAVAIPVLASRARKNRNF